MKSAGGSEAKWEADEEERRKLGMAVLKASMIETGENNDAPPFPFSARHW